ncbi:ORF11 [Halorubrum pleomorphic virus 3]|uniref:ORF11 n=1 Tax=Halorubrum pleomorphic virus 3 TaxID=1156720 RepID=H9ABP0_9VIRU|nr:ORF11 [Halorubrum pleomorphic virus 3]AFD04010.1 ORF11 [Halorubrum pleomorphic virus 3]
MTDNNRNPDGIAPSELFSRASQLPESNFEARTLAQICESEESDR